MTTALLSTTGRSSTPSRNGLSPITDFSLSTQAEHDAFVRQRNSPWQTETVRYTAAVPPTALIVDFSEVIWTFTPTSSPLSYLFDDDTLFSRAPLRGFVNQLTINDLIEVVLLVDRTGDSNPSSVWDMIEAKFPNGFGEFGDDANSLESFDFLIGLVAEAADDLLKRHSAQLGLSSEAYLDYYFNHWVTPTTGVLVHTSYDSSGS